jgi:hypothetical protein
VVAVCDDTDQVIRAPVPPVPGYGEDIGVGACWPNGAVGRSTLRPTFSERRDDVPNSDSLLVVCANFGKYFELWLPSCSLRKLCGSLCCGRVSSIDESLAVSLAPIALAACPVAKKGVRVGGIRPSNSDSLLVVCAKLCGSRVVDPCPQLTSHCGSPGRRSRWQLAQSLKRESEMDRSATYQSPKLGL